MRPSFLVASLVIASLVLAGCGAAVEAPEGNDDPLPPASCNALAQQGTSPKHVTSRGVAPVPAGGTLLPGTYVLTSVVTYEKISPDGYEIRDAAPVTMEIAQGTVSVVTTLAGEIVRMNATYELHGQVFGTTATCGGAGSEIGYTATATSLMTFDNDGSTTTVMTFTRR